MKTINIGNRSEAYIAEKANTIFVLDKGDTIDAGSSNWALYTDSDVANMAFEVNGTVKALNGIHVDASDAKYAVHVDIGSAAKIRGVADGIDVGGDGNVIRNDGLVRGGSGDGISTSGSTTVINAGDLVGGYAGLYLGSGSGDESVARNSGRIEGDIYAIRGGIGVEKVINSGVIHGDVLLGDGDDTFVMLSGRVVDGEVDGSLGDDTYILHRPGVMLEEKTGSGHDTVKANFSLSLAANFEDLFLTGKADLTGIGNAEANLLVGNAGRNVLIAGDGEDVLKGGKGDDVLTGGGADDAFHFARGTGTDIVTDWTWAHDELHLDGLKGATDYADMMANHVRQVGNDLWIEYGSDRIVLANSDVNDLNSGYVYFG